MNAIKNFIKFVLQVIFANQFLIYTLPGNKPVVALTFDDGPDPKHTPLVLDILRKNNIKATFFLTGKKVEQSPDTARQILREGHGLGNHSYEHKGFLRLSIEQKKEEILKTHKKLYEVLGSTVYIFRPPQGHCSLQQLVFCMKQSIRTILWSFDTHDYEYKGEEFLKDLLDKTRLKNGDIVLLHDDNMFTVNFLQYLIDRIKHDGFECVTIGDL